MLHIQQGTSTHTIAADFNSRYRYLRIKFPENVAATQEHLPAEAITLKAPVCISIIGQQTVATLQKDFLNKASMRIKMLCRFYNVWIETSLTGDWTLEQQNLEGKLLSELNMAAI